MVNTKTICVATNKKTIYESDDLGLYEYRYSLDINGVVNGEKYRGSYKIDDEWKETSSEIVYVIDYENIMQ